MTIAAVVTALVPALLSGAVSVVGQASACCGLEPARVREQEAETHYQIVQTLHFRRLPHLYALGAPLFVTFRLHDSLPPGRVFLPCLPSGKAFLCMDRLLDSERFGSAHLRIPAVADIVIASLRAGARADYDLHAWVLMPNHVHVLITPMVHPSVALRRLKGVSARVANRLLGLTGRPFWQDESYDHLVRHPSEFRRIENYILENPVRAGIAQTAEDYPWSSGFGGLKPFAD